MQSKGKFHEVIDQNGITLLIKQNMEKFTAIFVELGYLAPFQWILIESLLRGSKLRTFYETWIAESESISSIAQLASTEFVNQPNDAKVFFYNGMFRTEDNLVIDLALIQYFSRKDKDNKTSQWNIWSLLELNREWKRNQHQRISSLFLFIREYILALQGVKRFPFVMETKDLLIKVVRASSYPNLQTISQRVKELFVCGETGPPLRKVQIWDN